MSKAFDSIDHTLLLLKLRDVGALPLALQWFRSYLTAHYQVVKIGTASSERLQVASGVPQGIILGPLLFSIHMNDLPSVPQHCSVQCYVDDTKFLLSFRLPDQSRIIDLPQITVDFVYQQLKALNSKKSSGLHDIPIQLVKDGAEALARPLTLLMNRTINEGSLPADWKHAIITPVHKAGSKSDPSNFRPISVLPIFSKIGLQLFTGTQASFSSTVWLSPTSLYLHMTRTCDKHSAGKH